MGMGPRNIPGPAMNLSWCILFSLLLLFWNQTWITLMGSPVSLANCSLTALVGLGFALKIALNISWVSISKQSFSEDDQTQSYNDDVDFESWMSRQSELKENVRKACDKYGKSLNSKVPLNQFMYDSKHKLLYCRNAKGNYINISKRMWILQHPK